MNIFRMFLYYVTPATTKQVEELKRQREALLKYKYDSRRSLRSLQNAYLRMRGERDNKDQRLKKAGEFIQKLQADNKMLKAALFPEGEKHIDSILSGMQG